MLGPTADSHDAAKEPGSHMTHFLLHGCATPLSITLSTCEMSNRLTTSPKDMSEAAQTKMQLDTSNSKLLIKYKLGLSQPRLFVRCHHIGYEQNRPYNF